MNISFRNKYILIYVIFFLHLAPTRFHIFQFKPVRNKKAYIWKYIYIKLENTDANTTVKIPETAIARPLMAPSTSPISIALAVPIA